MYQKPNIAWQILLTILQSHCDYDKIFSLPLPTTCSWAFLSWHFLHFLLHEAQIHDQVAAGYSVSTCLLRSKRHWCTHSLSMAMCRKPLAAIPLHSGYTGCYFMALILSWARLSAQPSGCCGGCVWAWALTPPHLLLAWADVSVSFPGNITKHSGHQSFYLVRKITDVEVEETYQQTS